MRRPQVLIVGAGIGGLTTALELHRVGIGCRILEAAEELAPVGVGINVLPHAARVLGELGLEGPLSEVAVLTQESIFFNRFGQFIYREPAGRFAGYPDPQYSIHRADLHRVLVDAVTERLGPATLVTGHRVVGVDDGEHAAQVRVLGAGRAATTLPADVVIAADGIHSAVRKQLFPAEGAPRYSGVTMWRGVTVWPRLLTGASMIRIGWLAVGKLVAYPIRQNVDGSGATLLNWVAEVEMAQRTDRDWNRVGRLADFAEHYRDWRFDWLDVPSVFESTEAILEYPMVDQDPLPRWSHGRITLLGDAAHPMVPRGSNGAGQAILDARAVAECLAADPADPVAALIDYDNQRREATSRVVLANRADPPDAILREVYERSGDRPFRRIEDVIGAEELAGLSASYRAVAGFERPQSSV